MLGFYFEGLRIHQLPYMVGVSLHSAVASLRIKVELVNEVAALTAIGLVAVTVLLAWLYGDTNLDRVRVTGPYEVGHREFRSGTLGSEVSVFYPVDRDHYREAMRASKGKRNSMWLRHGEKTLLGIVKATRPYGQEKAPSIQVLRPILGIRMHTLE